MIGLIRRFYFVVLLTLSVAVPYAMFSDTSGELQQKIRGMFASRSQADELELIEGIDYPVVNQLLAKQQQLVATSPAAATVASGLTPTVTLAGILRFDVNPRWVTQYWPHVATTRSENGLEGLRVPVITGTHPQDVVGSITYYFDKQQRVQRLAMDGTMGDDRQMVAAVTKVFKLKPEPSAGPGVFVSKWNGDLVSAWWIRRMPVVHTRAGGQYEFVLEINRPGTGGLSPRLISQFRNAHASLNGTNLVR